MQFSTVLDTVDNGTRETEERQHYNRLDHQEPSVLVPLEAIEMWPDFPHSFPFVAFPDQLPK